MFEHLYRLSFLFPFIETDNRLLLEWHAKVERCQEETLLIEEDMRSYLQYYKTLIAKLLYKIDNSEIFTEVIKTCYCVLLIFLTLW